MKTKKDSGFPQRGTIALFVILGIMGVAFSVSGLVFQSSILRGQPSPETPAVGSMGVFTSSHRSVRLAVRHFFGLRSEPTQPIAYSHRPHIEKAQMECLDC